MSLHGRIVVYDTYVEVEPIAGAALTLRQLERLARAARAAYEALGQRVDEQPAEPAGAGANGEEPRALAASPSAPIDAAGSDQPKEEGDAGGAAASEAVDGTAFPSSSPTPCPECDKPILHRNLPRHLRMKHGADAVAPAAPEPGFGGQFKGNVINEDCPGCGRHFTWRPGLLSHQRGCEPYLEAVTAPAVTADPLPAEPKAPPWEPKPVPKADSVIKNGRERWLCARCTESFNTPEKRDEHQRFHPPVPVTAGPVGRGPRSVVDRIAAGGGSLQ